MTHEEAEAWCRAHHFDFYSFTTRRTGYENGPPSEGGNRLWDVSGWAWTKNGREKIRLFGVGPTLEGTVEGIRRQYNSIVTI